MNLQVLPGTNGADLDLHGLHKSCEESCKTVDSYTGLIWNTPVQDLMKDNGKPSDGRREYASQGSGIWGGVNAGMRVCVGIIWG